MLKVICNLIKDSANIDDKVICESMLASAKEGAMLYLTSTLTSTTPELRAIYSAATAQMIEGHTALTALSVKKQWVKPYDSPSTMLSCAFNCANDTATNKE